MSTSVSRRGFLKAAAVGATASSCAHVSSLSRSRPQAPVAVSSKNGIKAVEVAVNKMLAGLPPVDSAVIGIEPVENDPDDTSVGYGGLPNEDGVVELDSCVMDGPSGLAGAVASLRNIKNPSQVALKVMRRSDHVLLVAEGALRFARAHGFVEENLLTERARKIWLRWKEGLSAKDDWVSPEQNGEHGREHVAGHVSRPTGTIHVGCINADGDIGGCTSTSGLAFKIPGRVGDSPLIGCGNYVDNDYGVAGSTGRGEAVIISNGAARVVRYMAEGRSPTDACLDALRDIARMTRVPRLLNSRGEPDFQVNFYAINKAGTIGAAALRPSKHSRMDENGPEIHDSAALYGG